METTETLESTTKSEETAQKPRIWVVAAGNKGDQWKYFIDHNEIGLGDDLGNLKSKNKEEIKELCRKSNKKKAANSYVRFVRDAKQNDLFFARKGKTIKGFGRIDGEYVYDPKKEGYCNIRSVEWYEKELNINYGAVSQGALFVEFNEKYSPEIKDIIEKYVSNQYTEYAENSSELPDEKSDNEKIIVSTTPVFRTGYYSENKEYSLNRIIFGAPGTGKSYTLNQERKKLLGNDNETDYERVTFHPDYSYAHFVGTYKPVTVERKIDEDTREVISILTDKNKTAQEKYDLLYERFRAEKDTTRLPILLGLYTEGNFKTKKKDGDFSTNNDVERNHGKALRKYVKLLTGQERGSEISYEYVPGPFMRVYVNALKSARKGERKPFLLIIEEINRANVAAVFGDVFQLLDRDEDGVSEYPIQASEDIKKYLAKELGGNPDDYSKIRIPDNMFIWATMNSADQGVFPMDTAFKRRWDFTYLGIDDNAENIENIIVTVGKEKQQIKWNDIRKAINDFLAEHGINEDKQLGPYFIKEIDSEKFCEVFKHKVLMYLFEDAARQKRGTLFNKKRYSEICRKFDEEGLEVFCKEIQDKVKPVSDKKETSAE